MKKALLVCLDKYPNGDAGAVRTHVFAKLLRAIGYEPMVVGMGPSTSFRVCEEDGISYMSMCAPSGGFYERVMKYAQLPARLKTYVLTADAQWDLILASDVAKKPFQLLQAYAAKRSIPLLHDSVEWYSPEQFGAAGTWHPTYRAKDRLNRRIIDNPVRVIAISSYLDKHFSARGIATTRIPVIMDTESVVCDKCIDPQKIVFAYAGAPGKKDYLKTVVAGFALLAQQTDVPFELRLIGVTKEQLVSMCEASPADVEMLGEHLCCMGRVSRDEVLRQLSQADFTVLMRSEEQRYAKAGFPTKFVESLATATPVVANATSDIGEYLKDGENGFLVSACSPQALSEALEKAVALSYDDRRTMQDTARRTAVEQFDYMRYAQQLERFITKPDKED